MLLFRTYFFFLCNQASADQNISFHLISEHNKSPKTIKHQASTKSRKYFQPPRCSVMYLKHVKYIVSLQGRLTPSHKSHRLLTSAHISLLFSSLSKQLGRSLGTEFRICLKNSKINPYRVQISFRHWTIMTKANGQTSVTLYWIHWIELWCCEHSVPDVQFCINMIFRKIKLRRMRWAGHVTRMGEEMGAYRVLVGKPEGKIPMGRPRRR